MRLICSKIYNAADLLQNLLESQQTPHTSPSRASYGVSIVILISDSLSATVIAVSYVILWEIRPCYNGSLLFCDMIDGEVPLYLSFIPAWISNHTPNKVWNEIDYAFFKLQQLHH